MQLTALIAVLVAHQVTAMSKDEWIRFGSAAKLAEECKPFGIRVHWGKSISDPSHPQKLNIRFNTLQNCENIELLLKEALIVHCPIRPISSFTMSDGQTFSSFTHECSLSGQIDYDKPFTYNLIELQTENTYLQKDVSLQIIDPRDSKREVRFVHFADWARTTREGRSGIVAGVQEVLRKEKEIDGIIINGDLGYELNTNVEHHLLFMAMLESLARKTPIIVNRGNHEYGHAGKMFCQYFQVYGLCHRNATGLSIGAAYLALYDPQAALLPKNYDKYTQSERTSSVRNLALDLQRGTLSGRSVIALSHYPVVCSYPTPEHCIPMEEYNQFLPLYVNIQEHFDTLLDYKVTLLLAGHIHTYERSHRLLRGYKYATAGSDNQHGLIQVIEGVAGSDGELFGDYTYKGVQHQVKPFVAAYHLNTIGFGVLRVSSQTIAYQHFGVQSDSSLVSLDNFSIDVSEKDDLQNREEQASLEL